MAVLKRFLKRVPGNGEDRLDAKSTLSTGENGPRLIYDPEHNILEIGDPKLLQGLGIPVVRSGRLVLFSETSLTDVAYLPPWNIQIVTAYTRPKNLQIAGEPIEANYLEGLNMKPLPHAWQPFARIAIERLFQLTDGKIPTVYLPYINPYLPPVFKNLPRKALKDFYELTTQTIKPPINHTPREIEDFYLKFPTSMTVILPPNGASDLERGDTVPVLGIFVRATIFASPLRLPALFITGPHAIAGYSIKFYLDFTQKATAPESNQGIGSPQAFPSDAVSPILLSPNGFLVRDYSIDYKAGPQPSQNDTLYLPLNYETLSALCQNQPHAIGIYMLTPKANPLSAPTPAYIDKSPETAIKLIK